MIHLGNLAAVYLPTSIGRYLTTHATTMFYQPGSTPHNLPRDPFKVANVNTAYSCLRLLIIGQSCVVPRPIGWMSTIAADGKTRNLAPYSQFQNLTFDPPYVMFAANQTVDEARKDTVVNAEQTGRFCWNMATYDLRHSVNASAEYLEPSVDEFERAGVTPIKSELLGDCPMVKESPIRFECTYFSTIRLPGNPPMGTVDVVIGRVVGVHIADNALDDDGMIDLLKIKPIARCGYYQYTVINELFEMKIPGSDRVLRGLEGSALLNAKTHEENQERKGVVGQEAAVQLGDAS